MSLDSDTIEVVAIESTEITLSFRVSFEDAQARMVALPRLFFEPDGSFVWVSHDGPSSWQVDGVLSDAGDFVRTVEIKGTCPRACLKRLIGSIRTSDDERVIVQDVPRGVCSTANPPFLPISADGNAGEEFDVPFPYQDVRSCVAIVTVSCEDLPMEKFEGILLRRRLVMLAMSW